MYCLKREGHVIKVPSAMKNFELESALKLEIQVKPRILELVTLIS